MFRNTLLYNSQVKEVTMMEMLKYLRQTITKYDMSELVEKQ